MEINQLDVEIEDELPGLISVCVKLENQESESSDTDVIISEANNFCAIEIKEGTNSLIEELETSINGNNGEEFEALSLTFNRLDGENVGPHTSINNITNDPSITLGSLHPDIINEEIERRMSQASGIFIENDEKIENLPYNVKDYLQFDGLNLNVKKERSQGWLCVSEEEELEDEEETSCNNSLDSDISKGNNHRIEIPLDIKVTAKSKRRERSFGIKVNGCDKLTRRLRRKVKLRQDYIERLRRKAECMREKRRKLYEQETEEERLQRLAKEAAKRREMRMYYETPEQRRKRLDAEAARKREYRMYNETPEERRKRLDREAERRRIKRLTLYANETAEQRRERLNRESAKRREARLNQYSKETEDQRRERLRKDALRAREMRFTRSAIETEEERRQRLVKDALRKRELRTHGANSVSNFTELQNVRSFEELNNVQMRDDPDNQLGSHYLSNWMMWFQNTLTQPVHIGEQTIEPQTQNNG